MTPNEVIAERLSDLRRRRGWNQRELSDALAAAGLKLDPPTVNRIERGKRQVRVDEVFVLALVFDTTPLHLLLPVGETEPMEFVPGQVFDSGDVWPWVMGNAPLPGMDKDRYFGQLWPAGVAEAMGEIARSMDRARSEALKAQWAGDTETATHWNEEFAKDARRYAEASRRYQRQGFVGGGDGTIVEIEEGEDG